MIQAMGDRIMVQTRVVMWNRIIMQADTGLGGSRCIERGEVFMVLVIPVDYLQSAARFSSIHTAF